MAIIEVNNLSKDIRELQVLKNINLTVNRGEIFGIIGPDGAGKTTFLRILTGILPPTQGEVKVCDIDVINNSEGVKERIGVVPQNFTLYQDLTVEENLNFFSRMYRIPEELYQERKERLLHITHLEPFLKRRTGNLSGGMQKKLALISSFLHTPLLLLLDEPTTGVDPISRRELWDFFYELLQSGVTIVISTPYMDEAERCSKVGFLYHGELLLVEEPLKIKKNYPYNILEISGKGIKAIQKVNFLKDLNLIDIYTVGDRLHFVTARVDLNFVKKYFYNYNLDISIKQIEPSFEDAFISIIRREN